MSTPALDRDRLLADLRAAGAEALLDDWVGDDHVRDQLDGMHRAWRVIAAAIEDGEYNQPARNPKCQAHDRPWSAPCICTRMGQGGGKR